MYTLTLNRSPEPCTHVCAGDDPQLVSGCCCGRHEKGGASATDLVQVQGLGSSPHMTNVPPSIEWYSTVSMLLGTVCFEGLGVFVFDRYCYMEPHIAA